MPAYPGAEPAERRKIAMTRVDVYINGKDREESAPLGAHAGVAAATRKLTITEAVESCT
jgi:hypothetical protein